MGERNESNGTRISMFGIGSSRETRGGGYTGAARGLPVTRAAAVSTVILENLRRGMNLVAAAGRGGGGGGGTG